MPMQCVASLDESRHAKASDEAERNDWIAEKIAPEFQASLLSPAGIEQVLSEFHETDPSDLLESLSAVVTSDKFSRPFAVDRLICVITDKAEAMACSLAVKEAGQHEREQEQEKGEYLAEMRAAG